jgi:hypothetical protein
MRSYRLFLLAALVSLAAACSSPTGPKNPQEKKPPPEPDPTQGMVITPQQMGVWV